MAVSLAASRPKLSTTNAVTAALSVNTAVEVDNDGVEESHFIPILLGATDPASFTVASVTTTNGSNALTTTGNGFATVKVGDTVTGTGIPVSTTVTAKSTNNAITISNNASASGTITLTVDPPSGTPTMFALRLVYSTGGNVLSIKPYFYIYDGSLAPGVAGTAANATTTYELVEKTGKALTIDLDAFLTNYRVFRT